jgi:pimeloyl-ACP methyl ester carboxylesterase
LEAVVGSKIITKGGIRLYYHFSLQKTHSETIVFVHNMFGSHKSSSRHYRYLNEIGYDCVSFDLILGAKTLKNFDFKFLKYISKGVFYLWQMQIEAVLDLIEGDKIIFSFSGPCISALNAATKRTDVRKIICDGGPFGHIYSNTKNLFAKLFNISSQPLNSSISLLSSCLWGFNPIKQLHQSLDNYSDQLPILSIRGLLDEIVPIDTIDEIFKQHTHLNLTIVELPLAGHLNGLKDFPQIYKPTLLQFLIN